MYFFHPLNAFLQPGKRISSTEIWCIWRWFFLGSCGAWGQNPPLPHHCPGQLTIGRTHNGEKQHTVEKSNKREDPNNRLNCLQRSWKCGEMCAKPTKKSEKLEKLSARERIKENRDLPQILWRPDFTNTTENTLKILAEAIKQCRLRKIEKGMGYLIYHRKKSIV